MPKQLANAALFQLGWFACIFSPEHPWLLLLPLLVLGSLLIGVTLDSALLHLGLFDFGQPRLLVPLWLALLWPLLASTLRHALAWTAQAWWRAICAPLSYYAGAQLAGVALPYGSAATLLALALIWAAVLPLLHRLARSG